MSTPAEGTPRDSRRVMADALRTIERLRRQLADSRDAWLGEPIAVIGMSCRLPGGANSPEEFWNLLRNGVDATGEFPPDRADAAAVYHPDPDEPGKAYTIRGAFLDRVDRFEPEAFGISPREAVGMDPQHRIALEISWEALERAGYAPDRLTASRTGVYFGLSTTDYVRARQQYGDLNDVDFYQLVGEPSFLAGRISYLLGLRGPSKVVDTSCSSALVGLHEACQALRLRECDLALAGGVNLLLSPYGFVLMSKFRGLSADGRCKTFDAAADGYARGEGAGVVVLKRLGEAQADDDPILAVILGSAVNHDGRSSGLTVPSPAAQQAVIEAALAQARIDPAEVDYVEAHGTGTALGDPIELHALEAVLGRHHTAEAPLLVGSVKTNIGHLEPAAGIAGLIKVVLSIGHREIAPHLNLRTPNPNIEWDRLHVEIPTRCRPWPDRGHPPTAAVSSFGASGTNAHVILAAPPPAPPRAATRRPYGLFLASARTEEALRELADRHARWLRGPAAPELADACYTSHVGRAVQAHGLAVTAASTEELAEALAGYATQGRGRGLVAAALPRQRDRKVAWLFTGQGSQYPGMGRGLLAEPAFRAAFEQCAELFDAELDRPLGEVVWPAAAGPAPLDDTRYTQPALFAVEYALAQLWLSWGLRPALLAGHSLGEIVAACVAGVVDLPAAARLVAARSRLMAALPAGGAMASVFCPEERARQAIAGHADRLAVAAVNGPAEVTLSGDAVQLDAVLAALAEHGVRARRLAVSHAFHSPLIEPMLEPLREALAGITFQPPRIPLVSNLTGALWSETPTTAEYWLRHAAGTVRFADGVRTLYAEGARSFLEIGPQPVLCTLAARTLDDDGCRFLPSLRGRGSDDLRAVLDALGGLCLRGARPDWAAVHSVEEVRRVVLPTTPWRGTHYWFREVTPALPVAAPPPAETAAVVTGVGRRLRGAVPAYEVEPAKLAVAGGGDVLLGAVAELATAAATDCLGGPWWGVADLAGHAPLPAAADQEAFQLTVAATDDGSARWELLGQSGPQQAAGAPWTRYASGLLRRRARPASGGDPGKASGGDPGKASGGDPGKASGGDPVDASGGDLAEAAGGGPVEASGDGLAGAAGPAQPVGPAPGWRELLDAAAEALAAAAGPAVRSATAGPAATEPALAAPVGGDATAGVGRQAATAASAGGSGEGGAGAGGSGEGRLVVRGCAELAVRGTPAAVTAVRVRPGTVRVLPQGAAVGSVDLLAGDGTPVGIVRDLLMAPGQAPAAPWRDPARLLYDLDWQLLPATDGDRGRPGPRGLAGEAHLLVADPASAEYALVDRLAATLRAAGAVVTVAAPPVTAGEGDPGPDPATVRALVQAWCAGPDRPARVLVLTGLDAPAPEHCDASRLEEYLARADLTVLALLREMAARPDCPDARIALVTRGAARIAGDPGAPNPTGNTLWGLGRVLALEHPDRWGGIVDLDPGRPEDEAAALLDVLAGGPVEDQVALRGARRFGLRLVPAPLDAAALYRRPEVRPDGTYLVTGGFGGIGLLVAEWLARAGAGRLVLLARTPLPERAAWPDAPERLRDRIAAVRRLEELGAIVRVVAADVADEAAMVGLFTELEDAELPLRGVVHAAGVSVPQFARDVTPEAYRQVWRPKVLGGALLHWLSDDAPLDFFIGFSSIAATWGSQHLASYAASNAFLDGLAQHRAAAGLPALSVAWGPWDLPSALFGAEVMEFLRATGLRPLAPPQCVTLLGALAADPAPQRVVCAVDWSTFKPVMQARTDRPMLHGIDDAPAQPADAEPTPLLDELRATGDPARVRQLLTSYLTGLAGTVLGLDPATIDDGADVVGYGLDSLMVMDVVRSCRRDLRVSLRAGDLFARATLREWVDLVAAETGAGPVGRPGEAAGTPDDPATDPRWIRADVTLAPEVVPTGAVSRVRDPGEVLLTGATGFVGGYLLHELLATTAARVHCLVRCADPATGLERVRANLERYLPWPAGAEQRVRIVPGDLAKPALGLAQPVFEELADRLDGIYHCGAWVNFGYPYDQLRAANIGGTEEILRLAVTGRPTGVHHVSTYGIWGLPVPDRPVIAEDEEIVTAGRLVTGYVQTKWGAERLVELARARGVAVDVYRPGRVLGDSRTGACLTTHFTTRVIKGCLQLGAAPEIDIEVEMTPVDYVAAALVHISRHGPAYGRTYHLVNPRKLPFVELVAALRRHGYPIPLVPVEQWWQRLTASYGVGANELHPVLPVVREFVVGGEEAIGYAVRNADDALAGSGITCPAPDDRLLDIYLSWLIHSGYLPPPGSLDERRRDI
ncbi:thioester reductase domain-containing protein [Micromonospora sp. NPDC007271]|uniref:thioester reductase domain-containing protein n=1 Tax=Micromonospora sp. NPDC007271 TaxID=3154587 RepID=UPI0033E77D74